MEVFDLFPTTPYTFLQLVSGTGGNKSISETATTGIVKLREGLVQDGRSEAYTSASSLHMRPDESFITAVGGAQKLIGHGIRVEGVEYRIEGVTAGTDLETGSTAFYRCTLKREALWREEASALPLE